MSGTAATLHVVILAKLVLVGIAKCVGVVLALCLLPVLVVVQVVAEFLEEVFTDLYGSGS